MTLAIHGGQPAAPCELPGVVAISADQFCTGVLITPDVVVFAAHCGHPTEIVFGEDVFNRGMRIPTSYCETNPLVDGEPGGSDFAYCRLEPPGAGDQIPVPTPVLRGCEVGLVDVGTEVVMAGFGHTEASGPGTKHHVTAQISEIWDSGLLFVGTETVGTCGGDSGGPLLVELPDGSWRAAGILTGGRDILTDDECGATSAYILLDRIIPVLESISNVDMSPCHDETGTWQPSPRCLAPMELTGGSWATACIGATSHPATCGAMSPGREVSEPWATISEPRDGATVAYGLDVAFVAEAGDDVHPGGIRRVALSVDGEELPDPHGQLWDEVAPFGRYGLQLEPGHRILAARAESWTGTVTEVSVQIIVDNGLDPPGDPPAPEIGSVGCSCRAEPPWGNLGWMLVPGWAWRRRGATDGVRARPERTEQLG